MKALTVHPAWAHCIVHGLVVDGVHLLKDIENRGWPTTYRGPLLIHAGANMDTWWETYDYLAEHFGQRAADALPNELHTGAVIGVTHLSDVLPPGSAPRRWYAGRHGFVLTDRQPLRTPIVCRGQLGLWHPPADVLRRLPKRHQPKGPRPCRSSI